ncbi:MAG: urea ABC transporter permease subunit UrtC, partial [Verrucomicrobia bacterium]|nr:urea ABC transporter permease subunit UrtC [Verrucomicrobiota bacterium]
MQKSFPKAELWGIGLGTIILLGILPALNAFVPESSVFHISDFTINLYGKYLCYAVLAISVDLLWGYTGLLSLGQCLFFALGGYAFGMHLMLMIGKLGQYHSDLPDFMVFLGYPALPLHWVPFRNFWFAVAAVILAPGLLALVFGFLAFRSRIRGVYFSILTQALTYGACLMFFRNDFTFGGNNGLTDFKFILGYDIRSPATQRSLFIATGALLVATYAFCRWLTRTKFGKIQRALRDGENRVLFSGYAAANFKLFVFVVSAIIAGLAGALYVPQVGIINPSEMAPDKSLEAVVWVAVGGRGTLIGPIIGAIA